MLARYLAWTDHVLAGEAEGRELLLLRLWAVAAVVGFIASSWADTLALTVVSLFPLLAILGAFTLRDHARWRRDEAPRWRSAAPWVRRFYWVIVAIVLGSMLGAVVLDPHLAWIRKNSSIVVALLLVAVLSILVKVVRDRLPSLVLWARLFVSVGVAAVLLRAHADPGVKALLLIAWASVWLGWITLAIALTRQQDLASPSV